MSQTALADYAAKYRHIRLERTDGILEMTFHTDGGELVYGMHSHAELASIWMDLASDPQTDVIIVTGSGESFISKTDTSIEMGEKIDPYIWGARMLAEAKRAIMSQLEVGVPMIAAVNGPTRVHAEVALFCDIVLASEKASFQDRFHFPSGVVPGDGSHIFWPLLLGLNRARYFMMTGQVIGAEEARVLGLVNEVLPAQKLLERARELARQIQRAPRLTLRLTREAVLQNLKKLMVEGLGHGVLLEGFAGADHWPKTFPSSD